VTTVLADGAPAAVMLHDPAALRAPGLSDGVAAAVRLALDNVRLEADIRARVKDVEASRGRLLHARDAERRRLEALLSAGVGHRLEAAADALRALADDPDEVLSTLPGELDRTRAELHRFASGLHPRTLRTGGLAAALPELAAHAPVPVEVKVECGRLETTLEAAAWFVCSEGLANIAKHAAATRAAIGVRRERGRIVVTVDDDGRGGADRSVGRGLRGLAARVEAVGGGLDVDERPAGGTRVRATFPMKEAT
jgi:signal transduction histidine kinase